MGSEDDSIATAGDKSEEVATVASLGRRFILVKGPWIEKGVFDAKPVEIFDMKKRFDGKKVQGQFLDLLDILPNRLKSKVIQGGWSRHAVSGIVHQWNYC
jgi:hypothetical protein